VRGNSAASLQLVRYVINGVVATGVHFGVLTLNLKVLGMTSAGLANLIAAIAGSTSNFLGSRYFVFSAGYRPLFQQATKFVLLYATIASLHGLVLFGWTDVMRFDYRIGFVLATGLQFVLTYWGNNRWVFR